MGECKLVHQKHILVNGEKNGCRFARLKKIWNKKLSECFDAVV